MGARLWRAFFFADRPRNRHRPYALRCRIPQAAPEFAHERQSAPAPAAGSSRPAAFCAAATATAERTIVIRPAAALSTSAISAGARATAQRLAACGNLRHAPRNPHHTLEPCLGLPHRLRGRTLSRAMTRACALGFNLRRQALPENGPFATALDRDSFAGVACGLGRRIRGTGALPSR
jgi:hypothetical protein